MTTVPDRDTLDAVVADAGEPGLVFQPIIDLAAGTVTGFEVLARFRSGLGPTPDVWFDAANSHGLGGALQARVVRRALAHRDRLPPGTFVALNLDAPHLREEVVLDALGSDLVGVVVELTEREALTEEGLVASLEVLRERGAVVALDDVGAGHAGLQAILRVRPQLVKLDRSLIAGLGSDPAKRSLVRQLGSFANDVDAWVLAEGVETQAELDALLQLDVPLGQGWLFGRPAEEPATAAPADVQERISAWRRVDDATVARMVEQPEVVASDAALRSWEPTTTSVGVLLAPDGRVDLLQTGARRASGRPPAAPSGTAHPTERPDHVARRAMTRGDEVRFDPVVVVDDTGALVGVLTIERLVEGLSAAHRPATS